MNAHVVESVITGCGTSSDSSQTRRADLAVHGGTLLDLAIAAAVNNLWTSSVTRSSLGESRCRVRIGMEPAAGGSPRSRNKIAAEMPQRISPQKRYARSSRPGCCESVLTVYCAWLGLYVGVIDEAGTPGVARVVGEGGCLTVSSAY